MLRGSPPTNTGDGQKMALQIGAQLDRLDQANINPIVITKYQGRRHGMPLALVDYAAHCIIIDRHAKRFVSEGDRNIGVALTRRNPATGEPLHLPV